MTRLAWSDTVLPRLRALQKDSATYRVLSAGTRAYASVVNKSVKRTIASDTGLLKRSIGVKHIPKGRIKRRHFALSIVGGRKGFKTVFRRDFQWSARSWPQDPSKYAHLVNDGTKPHVITRRTRGGRTVTVKHPGTTGQRFLERALAASSVSGQAAMTAAVDKALAREAVREAGRIK